MKKLFATLIFALVFAATVFTGCGACDSGTVEDNNGTTTGTDTNGARSYAGSVMDDTMNDLDNAFNGGNSGAGTNGRTAGNSGTGSNGGTGSSVVGSTDSASAH
ncbi:MAG: hypothetical protein J6L81_07410 [Clostridia bacterium]|nr:hypothetical protein [Clostridia bacterium]